MKRLFFILASFCLAALPSLMQASSFKTGDKIVIDQPVTTNLYLAGEEISIDAVIEKDLVAAGGDFFIQDSLLDDVTIAGGHIRMNGYAGDDVKLFAGKIEISKDIRGDLLIVSGEVYIAESVTIWGDLIVAGGAVTSKASIKGDVKIYGGDVKLLGAVEGHLAVRAEDAVLDCIVNGDAELSAENLSLGSKARFFRMVKYWTKEGPIDFQGHLGPDGSSIFTENLKHEPLPEIETVITKVRQSLTLYKLLSGLVLIFILIWFFGKNFDRISGQLTNNAFKYYGLGAALFLGLPLLSLIAMLTVLGMPLGFIGFSLFFIALLLAGALSAVIIGYELKKYRNSNAGNGAMFFQAAAIYCVMTAMTYFMPFFGNIAMSVIVFIACGYLIYKLINRRSNDHHSDGVKAI